jgi:hypothetical protein
MPYFVRPNGELVPIVTYQPDDKTRKVLIGLENGLSRWFGYEEIRIVEGQYVIINVAQQ